MDRECCAVSGLRQTAINRCPGASNRPLVREIAAGCVDAIAQALAMLGISA